MVIDSSAILAILLNEPQKPTFIAAISAAEERSLSAASLVECSVVLDSRYGAISITALDHFIAEAGIDIIPVDANQARLARLGFRRFGKGNHPARLNFGDCFSYALSRALEQPLLFKGRDFSQTDVEYHPASGKAGQVNEQAATYDVQPRRRSSRSKRA